jgi:hypothetical protein
MAGRCRTGPSRPPRPVTRLHRGAANAPSPGRHQTPEGEDDYERDHEYDHERFQRYCVAEVGANPLRVVERTCRAGRS